MKEKYEIIKTKFAYDQVLASGFFFELYPELSGNWIRDAITIGLSREAIDSD